MYIHDYGATTLGKPMKCPHLPGSYIPVELKHLLHSNSHSVYTYTIIITGVNLIVSKNRSEDKLMKLLQVISCGSRWTMGHENVLE